MALLYISQVSHGSGYLDKNHGFLLRGAVEQHHFLNGDRQQGYHLVVYRLQLYVFVGLSETLDSAYCVI
jgi:hypothetical protein